MLLHGENVYKGRCIACLYFLKVNISEQYVQKRNGVLNAMFQTLLQLLHMYHSFHLYNHSNRHRYQYHFLYIHIKNLKHGNVK